MPQDNWGRGRVVCCAGEVVYGHDVDRGGNLFVATDRLGGRLLKINRRFVEIASVAITPPIVQVRTDNQGNVYAARSIGGAGNAGTIQRFDNNLSPLGSVSIPAPSFQSFEILNSGEYVVKQDFAPFSLAVFNSSGSIVRTIGTVACSDLATFGNLCVLYDLEVLSTGEIAFAEANRGWVNLFAANGSFIARTTIPAGGTTTSVTAMPAGNLMVVTDSNSGIYQAVVIPDARVGSTPIANVSFNGVYPAGFLQSPLNFPSIRVRASPSGDFFLGLQGTAPYVGITYMPSGFRSLGSLFGSSPLLDRPAIPQPRIISTTRQPSSTIINLAFTIDDEDDSTVDARILGFRQGVVSLANALRLTALINGTTSQLGPNTPTGVLRNVAWDAAIDLGTSQPIVQASFQVFAKDGRGLIDLDFVAIPAGIPQASDPVLVVTRTPITDEQLLDAWLWLVASNDPRITFENGEVRAAGGAFGGQLLATGTVTTTVGRGFLFGILGLREATTAERTRAREASTPGIVNQFPPRNGMPFQAVPSKVNQFGIDTGASAGYWVVLP
jgi:hypothetical protein